MSKITTNLICVGQTRLFHPRLAVGRIIPSASPSYTIFFNFVEISKYDLKSMANGEILKKVHFLQKIHHLVKTIIFEIDFEFPEKIQFQSENFKFR